MKPVIFEYAFQQRPSDFAEICYSYDDDVSKLSGISLIAKSREHILKTTETKKNIASNHSADCIAMQMMTKTDVARESDDSSLDEMLGSLTKTKVQRESDDDCFDIFLNYASNTAIGHKTDDTRNDLILMLLTKTETSRESDE